MEPELTEERWRRVESLFHRSLECSEPERQAFLDNETGGDPELRRYVEEMLAHSGDASLRIAGSIAGLAQLAAEGGGWSGRRVGPYRLVREIGRGGMGIVFEASRDDAEYRRTVALKILPAWRDQPGLRERFRNERQILCGLDHPNIARFLDGGTERGIPYFVMEYVDGISLADWRRLRRPRLRECLDLFRQVCAAVHCAHENLIVHRDLKPANILVTSDGAAKLLDFGIAKLLAPIPGENTATTEFRQWTPDYTSPEQVRGRPITTRTDVYSLGLILYELLCGHRAQTADMSSPLALDRSVCESEPALPSDRAAASGDTALQRQLRGDLDTIVAKAICKDPQQRYSSATALSADVERYLDGRPVQARPLTLAYRVGKLIRRRRLAFGAAALVLAAVIGGVWATIYQERRAERRFQQVRWLANALVFDVHDRIQYLPGATDARKAIVAIGLRYLESLRPDAAGDASLALELAAAYRRIGDVQGNPLLSSLHDMAGARASYTSARTLLAPLVQQQNAHAQLAMAQVVYDLGLIEYAQGNAKASGDDLSRAGAMVRRLADRYPRDVECLKLTADISSEAAREATISRQAKRAEEAAQQTVEVARRVAALDPSSNEALEYLAVAQSTLGSANRAAGQIEKAARSFRDSAATREQLVSRAPDNIAYQRSLMMSYGHVADAVGIPRSGGLGDLDAATRALAKAMAIARRLRGQDPADRTARNDLANVLMRAGDVMLAQPHLAADGVRLLAESEQTFTGLIKEDPANQRVLLSLLYVQRKLAEGLELSGRDADASRKLVAERSLAASLFGTRNEISARAASAVAGIDLARIKARAHDPSALALANSVARQLPSLPLRITGIAWGEAMVYGDLGNVFLQLGQRASAAYWLQKSTAVWREIKVPDALESQRAANLASAQASLGQALRLRSPTR